MSKANGVPQMGIRVDYGEEPHDTSCAYGKRNYCEHDHGADKKNPTTGIQKWYKH